MFKLISLIILPVDNGPLSAGKSIEEEEFMITQVMWPT